LRRLIIKHSRADEKNAKKAYPFLFIRVYANLIEYNSNKYSSLLYHEKEDDGDDQIADYE
jgi:hypothetical protein